MIPQETRNYMSNGAGTGQRNEKLFAAACQMRDDGANQQEVQEALLHRGLQDGLNVHEVHKTLQSVFTKPAREAAGRGQVGRR